MSQDNVVVTARRAKTGKKPIPLVWCFDSKMLASKVEDDKAEDHAGDGVREVCTTKVMEASEYHENQSPCA